MGHPPAPADVHRTARCALERRSNLAETMPQLGLLKIDDLADMALAAAVVANHGADPLLGRPVRLLHDGEGPLAT